MIQGVEALGIKMIGSADEERHKGKLPYLQTLTAIHSEVQWDHYLEIGVMVIAQAV